MDAEKTVVLNEVSREEADSLMQDTRPIKGVREGVPEFTQVTAFTTFRAEYALINGNLVVHFFDTPEHPNTDDPNHQWYWTTYFPNCLSSVGTSYFQATKPRLIAKYTEEMKSWFFRAQGYSHLLDLDGFVMKFLDALDADLEEARLREKAPS